jgi:hypothetical protein
MNIRLLAVAVLVVTGSVRAAEEAPIGPETRAWVDLQTSNTAASPVARPMPGDIAEKVYQRHADSFAQPIPESLGRDSFVGGGDGGGE